jgi:WD40 repeat protein
MKDYRLYEWTVAHRFRLDGEAVSVSFSPDGKILASGFYSSDLGKRAIVLWDTSSGGEHKRIDWPGRGDVTWVSLSPDGLLLASGSMDRTICLWEVSSGKRLCCLDDYCGHWNSGAFSPDGHLIAAPNHDTITPEIHVWEVPSGKEVRRLKVGHAGLCWRQRR